jgi:hypothetical protein
LFPAGSGIEALASDELGQAHDLHMKSFIVRSGRPEGLWRPQRDPWDI